MRTSCITARPLTHLAAGALCAFGLALLSLAGAGQERGGGEQRPAMGRVPKEDVATLEKMQGGWRLASIHLPGWDRQYRQETAFLLVAQEFMSIEMHLGYFIEEEMTEGYFQSATYRLRFDERGRMQAMTLIGAYSDEEEGLEYARPGETRSFRVSFREDELVLRGEPDRSELVFTRLATERYGHDFFGRGRPPAPAEEPGAGDKDGDGNGDGN